MYERVQTSMETTTIGMNTDLNYLNRTAQLALLATSQVLDSPRVGSVLVHEGRIIGEGYHRQAGRAHAEVNCLKSVRQEDRPLISESILYVSLEPCCIIGKTGACSTLILKHQIKTVVIGHRDSTPGVAGSSLEILRAAGVEVREYSEHPTCYRAYQFRHTLVTEARPFITLKYAQSADGFLRPVDRAADYWITNPISRRLVHKWRATETAIIVGARTVLEDGPSLTTRLFPGPNAVPVVIDPRGLLSGNERVFRGPVPGILFSSKLVDVSATELIKIPRNLAPATLGLIVKALGQRRLANVTLEGGAALLNAFLDAGLWDEAKVFTGAVKFGEGLIAPEVKGDLINQARIGSDLLSTYRRSIDASKSSPS